MNLVRGITEDGDDVIHPSWRQLVQHSNGGRTSDICSDGPCDPAETRDNRSSGKVCAQGPSVKHTRLRCGTGKYADGQVVNTNERGEYEEDGSCPVVKMESTQISHLAPQNVGQFDEVSSERRSSSAVVNCSSTTVSQLTADSSSVVSYAPVHSTM